ncbi:hypothetical protein FQA39_LY14362 [Lamprigera yunnana]|nr:hypothetical protein FQA39_LY14362 [Lamprigera yunnana]
MLFFGNVYAIITLKKSISTFLEDIYNQTVEPFFGFFIFNQPILFIRDPDLIKSVLIKDFDHFPDRSVMGNKNDKYSAKTLFMLKGPEWKRTRTKATPAFSSGKLKNMIPLIVDASEKLIEHIEFMISNNELIDSRDVCIKYAIDVISACAFGFEAQSHHNSEFANAAKHLQGITLSRNIQTAAHFFAPMFVNLFGFKFADPKSAQFLANIFLTEVAKRELNKQSRGDFIDLLIKMKEEKTYFDNDALVGLALQYLVAGFETSGSTISYILYELCLNEAIQNRLRDEILTVLENHHSIKLESVQEMSYLDMVIKEGLRKYPTLAFLDRVCTKNYKIPNSKVVVEKGIPIYISVSALHYDPKYFPNPENFDPERFSPKNKSDIIPCTYMPFGEGYRNCLGAKFGTLAVSIGLIQILKQFKVELSENAPRKLQFKTSGFLMTPVGDTLNLIFKKLK